jgi:hypothetical protein
MYQPDISVLEKLGETARAKELETTYIQKSDEFFKKWIDARKGE